MNLKAIRSLLLSLLLLAALLGGALPAAAQEGAGVIEGQVTLPPGVAPDSLQAELLFLPNGQGPPVITPQPLGADGSFRYTGVDTAPQHRYLVRVKLNEEDNYSELLAFEPDETNKTLTLRIFERTEDASALQPPDVSYILDTRPGGWVVGALYTYINAGEKIIENAGVLALGKSGAVELDSKVWKGLSASAAMTRSACSRASGCAASCSCRSSASMPSIIWPCVMSSRLLLSCCGRLA